MILVVVYVLSSCSIHKVLLLMPPCHFYLLHPYPLYLFSCLQLFPFMLSSPQLRRKSVTIGSSAVAQSSLHLSYLISCLWLGIWCGWLLNYNEIMHRYCQCIAVRQDGWVASIQGIGLAMKKREVSSGRSRVFSFLRRMRKERMEGGVEPRYKGINRDWIQKGTYEGSGIKNVDNGKINDAGNRVQLP